MVGHFIRLALIKMGKTLALEFVINFFVHPNCSNERKHDILKMSILQNWFRLVIQVLNAWNEFVLNNIVAENLELVSSMPCVLFLKYYHHSILYGTFNPGESICFMVCYLHIPKMFEIELHFSLVTYMFVFYQIVKRHHFCQGASFLPSLQHLWSLCHRDCELLVYYM